MLFGFFLTRDDRSPTSYFLRPDLLTSTCGTREPTTLESFSRAIRSYVPGSISIPSASPTPPLVSRPVSIGRMTNYSQGTTVSRMSSNQSDPSSRRYSAVDLDNDLLGTSPQSPHSPGNGLTTYPGAASEEDDQIIWSGWDSLGSGSTFQ